MRASTILHSFAGQTSLHGVPKVIVARSTVGRCIWIMICSMAGLVFIVQVAEVLQRFLRYPKKVTIEVVAIPVPFPAVSVCNMRNLDFHVLNTINSLFVENEHPINHINSTESQFVREYMRMVAKYGPLWYEYQDKLDYRTVFQEVFSRTTFSANIPEDVISEAAVQLNDFFVTCFFGGNRCDMSKDFSTFFDSYYYNCFTYTAPPMPDEGSNDHHVELMSLSEGVESGWSVVVFTGNGILTWNSDVRLLPGLHESHSAVAASEGVRVVIHPSDTQPFPFAEGYDVPPGHSASFGVRPRRNIRVGPPHGNCSHSNPFDETTDDVDTEVEDDDKSSDSSDGSGSRNTKRRRKRYRGISCQKMCLQSHVISACHCYDTSLPFQPELRRRQRRNAATKLAEDEPESAEDRVRPCRLNEEFADSCMDNATDDCLDALMTMYNRIQCARRTRDTVTRNTTLMGECGCHPPCDEFQYDVSYSLSKWPASGFEGDSAFYEIFYVENFRERFNSSSSAEKNSSVWNYFRDENRRETMKDFSRLNVYIADSSVVVTQETADFQVNQLVSDIGGQLGIWVGISVITLSEVVELVYLLIRHFLSSRRKFTGRSSTAVRSKVCRDVSSSDTAACSLRLKNASSASRQFNSPGCGCLVEDSRNGKCCSGGAGGATNVRASGGSVGKDCCSIGSGNYKSARQTTVDIVSDDELCWIEYDRRYRPNEYMTYSRRSGTDQNASGTTTNGFTFEPMERPANLYSDLRAS